MANVIREDVISIDFDINGNIFSDMLKQIDEFKQELCSGFDTSDIDNIKKSAEPAKEAMKDLEEGVKSAKESADFFYESMKKACAVDYDMDFSGIAGDIEIFDARLEVLKDNLKALGNAFAHPVSTIKNGLSNVKNEISETVNKIRSLAQTKLSNLTSNIKEVYSTISRGQTGAKGFVTALKSIGKVSLEKTISGFESIKKSIKGITFDKIKSGLSTVKSGISTVISGFKKFDSAAKNVVSKIKSAFTGLGNKIKSVANSITSSSDAITSKLFNVKSLVAGIATGATVQKSIDIVVDRQNITSQFEVLLGSAEKAQERVSELTDFAGMTPFTRDEIFAASKQLQVFTGNALSTGDSLRVIGDVAAGTGQPFEEVALWVGRLYDALKSGGTVGEMTSRLQEMGAISGEDRTKIEDLAEVGGDIKNIWGDVEKIFGRYDGTMEKLSNNLGNMLTSLKSFATNSIFMPLGEGIASGLQPAIQKFRDFRKSNKADVEAMGEVIHNFAQNICVPLFNKIEQGVEFVIKAIGSLKDGISGLNNLKGTSPPLDKLIDAFSFVFAHKDAFIDALKKIAAAMGGIVIAGKFTKIISALSGLLNPLTLVTAAFGVLFTALKNDSENGGTALSDLKNIAVTVFDAIKDSISVFSEIISNNKAVFTDVINTIVDLLPPLVEAFGELLTAGLELATVALPVLLDVFKELFNAVKPLLEKLPEFIGFITDIIKSCAKANVIEKLVKVFISYKVAMAAVNAVAKIHNGLLVLQAAKTKIATAATKLFSRAMNANPIMLVVSAIGLLIGGLTAYSAIAGDSSDDTDTLKENIDNVTGSVQNMRDAFDNAKSTLPGIDKLWSDSGFTSSDIDQKIAKKEEAITKAIKDAVKAQDDERKKDINNIRRYMEELEGLEDEKLLLYTKQQSWQNDVLMEQLKFDPNDTQAIANILKGVDESFDQSINAITDSFSKRSANIAQYYQSEKDNILKNEMLNSTAKTEMMKGLANLESQEQQKLLKEQNDQRTESLNIKAEAYDLTEQSEIKKTFKSIDEFKKNMNENLEAYNELDKKFRENESNSWLGGMYSLFHRDETKNLDKAKDNVFGGIDTDSIQQIQNLFTVLSKTKVETGKLSAEAKDQINDIIPSFENLSKGLEPAGKEMFSKFIEGMTDEKGNLIDTADMSLKEMINTVRNTLDVASPDITGKAKNIISQTTESIKNGISNANDMFKNFNSDPITNNADTMSKKVGNLLTEMNNSSQRNSCSMRRNVETNTSGMSASVTASIKSMSTQTVGNLKSMANNVISTVMQMRSGMDGIDLYSSGVNIMNGLINGMQSKLASISAIASEAASTVKNTISHALDIHSPSRVLYKIGEYTGMGQINGMKSMLPEIHRTADKMGQQSVPDISDDKKYSPSSNTISYSRSSTAETVNYAPVFNLTISGTSDDRAMARKIKKMIAEAMEEMTYSYESKSRTVREV